MAKTLWLNNGKLVTKDGKLVLCETCPCKGGVAGCAIAENFVGTDGTSIDGKEAYHDGSDNWFGGWTRLGYTFYSPMAKWSVQSGGVNYSTPTSGYPKAYGTSSVNKAVVETGRSTGYAKVIIGVGKVGEYVSVFVPGNEVKFETKSILSAGANGRTYYSVEITIGSYTHSVLLSNAATANDTSFPVEVWVTETDIKVWVEVGTGQVSPSTFEPICEGTTGSTDTEWGFGFSQGDDTLEDATANDFGHYPCVSEFIYICPAEMPTEPTCP